MKPMSPPPWKFIKSGGTGHKGYHFYWGRTFSRRNRAQPGTPYNDKVQGVARVLIDNGSALNVCPLITIMKLGVDKSALRSCNTIIRAFDGAKREVLGEIDLPVEIGPYTFEVTFQVLDIPTAYNFLLGRPWVHFGRSCTLQSSPKHQVHCPGSPRNSTCRRGLHDSQISSDSIHWCGEWHCPWCIPHLRSSAHHLYSRRPSKPRISNSNFMVAKVMIENGSKPGKGIGRYLQERSNPIE